jgi:hypothetical protein
VFLKRRQKSNRQLAANVAKWVETAMSKNAEIQSRSQQPSSSAAATAQDDQDYVPDDAEEINGDGEPGDGDGDGDGADMEGEDKKCIVS